MQIKLSGLPTGIVVMVSVACVYEHMRHRVDYIMDDVCLSRGSRVRKLRIDAADHRCHVRISKPQSVELGH